MKTDKSNEALKQDQEEPKEGKFEHYRETNKIRLFKQQRRKTH